MVKEEPSNFCDNGMLKGWKRNQILIDFDFIPDPISDAILQNYQLQSPPNRSGLLNYFIKHRLKYLIDCIGDF